MSHEIKDSNKRLDNKITRQVLSLDHHEKWEVDCSSNAARVSVSQTVSKDIEVVANMMSND